MNEDEYEEVPEGEYEIVEYVFEESGIDYTGVTYVDEGES